jgi:Nucleotidyl transferase AbiEii toxin, Type IV TA system
MIDRRELLAAAGNLGLLPSVVEKDYVLGWVLAGIFNHPVLAKHWVFKGGTCLKKCYFETYRFSEDLDFTLTDESISILILCSAHFVKFPHGSMNKPESSSRLTSCTSKSFKTVVAVPRARDEFHIAVLLLPCPAICQE